MLPGVAGTLFQYFQEAAWLILESAGGVGWPEKYFHFINELSGLSLCLNFEESPQGELKIC
jgi:hypothetical protein